MYNEQCIEWQQRCINFTEYIFDHLCDDQTWFEFDFVRTLCTKTMWVWISCCHDNFHKPCLLKKMTVEETTNNKNNSKTMMT